jgi:tRNA1(Val) A37 N6-methylase TrmN6
METALDFFNNELDDILQLYPSEWDDIQLIYIRAKKLEKKQLIYFAKYILHQNHEYKSYTNIVDEWFERNKKK